MKFLSSFEDKEHENIFLTSPFFNFLKLSEWNNK